MVLAADIHSCDDNCCRVNCPKEVNVNGSSTDKVSVSLKAEVRSWSWIENSLGTVSVHLHC